MIFEPITLKNVTFRNRILRSSVGGRMCAYNGMVTNVWRNFEKKFADGGVGGIISTTFIVNPNRQSPFEYPSLADDRFVGPLRDRLAEVKESGVRYIIQLGDPGAATHTSLFPEREDAASSSSGFEFMYGYANRRVAMTEAEIRAEIRAFADAAERAREAGADGIEITAEKGYIIHQFLNPGFNRRTDGWGGSPEKRFRLLREIVAAVRSRIGDDYLVGVRLSAADYNYLPLLNFVFRVPWVFPLRHHWMGNDLDDTLEHGRQLKALGVDFLHVVSGTGFINPRGSPGAYPAEEVKLFCNSVRNLSLKAAVRATLLNLIPSALANPLFNIGWRKHEGISLGYAKAFKTEVGLPVIANGGFQQRPGIESALGTCDFVSMARALIATPDLVRRFERGEEGPERDCTFCNRCCARTPTSPLGCYEPERFPSRQAMVDQILGLNAPVP